MVNYGLFFERHTQYHYTIELLLLVGYQLGKYQLRLTIATVDHSTRRCKDQIALRSPAPTSSPVP